MPIAHIGGNSDNIAGADQLSRRPWLLSEAQPGCDDQRLPQWMGMHRLCELSHRSSPQRQPPTVPGGGAWNGELMRMAPVKDGTGKSLCRPHGAGLRGGQAYLKGRRDSRCVKSMCSDGGRSAA